jgi:hypothetical protein
MNRFTFSDNYPACQALKDHPEWLDIDAFSVMIPGALDRSLMSPMPPIGTEFCASQRTPLG